MHCSGSYTNRLAAGPLKGEDRRKMIQHAEEHERSQLKNSGFKLDAEELKKAMLEDKKQNRTTAVKQK